MPREKVVGYVIGDDAVLFLCHSCALKLLGEWRLRNVKNEWKLREGYDNGRRVRKFKDKWEEWTHDGTYACECCDCVIGYKPEKSKDHKEFLKENPSGFKEIPEDILQQYLDSEPFDPDGGMVEVFD